MLTPPEEFLAACPKFRILVLGNPESTKHELFTKIFGVDLEKVLVDNAFSPSHNINQELNLHQQNSRLAIHTSLNFGTGDDTHYDRVRDFLLSRATPSTKQEDRIHCIWYCVASEEDRLVSDLERRFFSTGLQSAAPGIPLILVFTKYEEFVSQVKLAWSRDAQERGLSKVAVRHILRDLSSKKFDKQIGKRWDGVLGGAVKRVRVSSGDSEDDAESFEELAEATLAGLRERSVKYAFAAAQRNEAFISTRYCADTASTLYFSVSTTHARKLPGTDTRDILPHFLSLCLHLFNLRDPTATLISDPSLLTHILTATFPPSQTPLLSECLQGSSSTDPKSTSLLANLSPHERAVLLTQCLAAVLLFFHRLADAQWPHEPESFLAGHTSSLTPAKVTRVIDEIRQGRDRKEVLETVEGSTIFTTCTLQSAVADLIVSAIERADRVGDAVDEGSVSGYGYGFGTSGYHHHHAGEPRAIIVEDDDELQEISLSFVNDTKGPEDVVLPCGLTILPLM